MTMVCGMGLTPIAVTIFSCLFNINQVRIPTFSTTSTCFDYVLQI
jgi:hypothetical protein